tara:strand:- start:3241 stop:5385 length:2145 start_codon:yes stop_codon:yes gene_type:complete
MPEILTIPNTSSSMVSWGSPWDFDLSDMPEFESKSKYREWEAMPSTKSCLFSTVEGEIPNQRLSKNNPPRRLLGVVADYDRSQSDEEFQAFMKRAIDQDFPLSYVSRSFSGGIHAVWLFEKPISIPTKRHLSRLLTRVKKELDLEGLARGFDKQSYQNLYTYYSIGSDWRKVSDSFVPMASLYHWCFETSKSEDYSNSAVEIPMEEVVVEMERQFPGEIPDMQNGSRCRYFWGEPQGTNTSACIVRPEGITVFTDTADKPFYSWAEILGTEFVRKFQEDKIGECISSYWFDGKDYVCDEGDRYKVMNKESLLLSLECRHSLSRNRPRGGGPSEIQRALFTIEDMKYVDGLLPFVYLKDRIVDFRGKSYFNTSSIRPLAPADGDPGKWGEGFPNTARWMESMFGDEQLPYEIAWLGYAYRNMLEGNPQKGHAHFLVGPPNCGKTLYNTTVLADLFGGHMKATEYFLGKINFNDYLFEEGLWTIDDSAPASDKKRFDEFTSLVKEFVANDEFSLNAKFKKAGRVRWLGRLAISLNDDPESIRLIPDLGASISDKIMVFLCKPDMEFTRGFRQQVREELPFFARWLRSQEVPSEMSEVRFGVQSYLNPTAQSLHQASGELETFIAIVDWIREKYCDPDIPGRDGFWSGTAGQILRTAESDGARALTRSLTPTSLGIGLNKLYLSGLRGLKRVGSHSNKTYWEISFLDAPASPDFETG